MFFRYFKATLKRTPGNMSFPLVFLIPILVLISINTVSSVGSTYQKYTFYANSNFKKVVTTVDPYDNSFRKYLFWTYGHYYEEYSTQNNPVYGAETTPELYFCKSEDALETSYFTEKNLLEGELPNKRNFEELQKKGLFPLCISYYSASEADSWIGDELHIRAHSTSNHSYTTLRFKITGIMYPGGYGENSKHPFACALIDEHTYNELHKILGYEDELYCNFINEMITLNRQTDSITMDELQQDILYDFLSVDKISKLFFSVLIMIVISGITYNLLRFKIKGDVRILSTMGMHSSGVLMIHFLRAASAIAVSTVLSTLFIKFIYLPLFVSEYYPFTFIVTIGLVELVLGLITCGAMAFILRRK